MRPKFGQQFKVKWIDAFGDSAWTDDKALEMMLDQIKPEVQTLYFIKSTKDFYIFTSGKPEKGHPYIDIHAIPRGWIQSIRPVRV